MVDYSLHVYFYNSLGRKSSDNKKVLKRLNRDFEYKGKK